MTQAPQEEIQATRFTVDERRMLRLLTMLPAPHSGFADGIEADEARQFWNVMSEHLGTVREPSGAIKLLAAHAGAAMEEALAGIRQAAKTAAASAEGDGTNLDLRLRVRRLANHVFSIFGELSDRQRAALSDALRPSRPQGARGFVDEWLRQLHEAAMNVIVDNSPIEMDSASEFGYLDRIWGHPEGDDLGFFPHNLEGFGVKEMLAKARPIVKGVDDRFEVAEKAGGAVTLATREYPALPVFHDRDFESGLVEKQARKVLSALGEAEVYVPKKALEKLVDRKAVKLL